MKLLASLLILLFTSLPLRAEQKFVSVCTRSVDVQEQIISQLGKECWKITESDLTEVKELKLLVFEENPLQPDDFANLKNLRMLNIESATKTIISARLLRDLSNLNELFLDKVTIEANAFDHLAALKLLSMRSISRLPEGSLRNLRALVFLDLSFVRVGNSLWMDLRQLPNIKRLHLTATAITEVDNVALQQMKNLNAMKLNLNDFSKGLAPQAFDGVTSLQYLEMNENGLKLLNPRWAQQMPQLLELDLSLNPIETIDSKFFAPLTSLQALNLINTGIKHVSAASFPILPELRRLNLDQNFDLQRIDDFAFIHLKRLNKIEVANAPLRETRKAAFFGVANVIDLPLDFDQNEVEWGEQ